jgi:glutathione S-transferase
MLLYVTDSSPYARMARVVRREQHLEDRVEEKIAATRTPNSPYYKINPSGRVPYLVCDDGVGIEGSQPVCYVLDHLDDAPILGAPDGDVGIAYRRLEEYARTERPSGYANCDGRRKIGRPRSSSMSACACAGWLIFGKVRSITPSCRAA